MVGLLMSNWLTFLSQTVLHGAAYVPSGRNRAEVVFWSLAIILFLGWAGFFCTKAFIELAR